MDEVFPLEDGVGLNVVRSGAPDAPVTVVLAHGYALDHRSWFRVVPELAHDELQVVAYDHRGHGQSGPATPETATIERLGDDLAELIERGVDSERVVVVGHSMGGMAAMALVERHPRLFGQRVAGLGFLSTAVGRRGETSLAWPQAVGKLVEELEKVFGPVVRHIRGRIENRGGFWYREGDNLGSSPAHKIRENAKMLASLIRSEVNQLQVPPVESVVILTHQNCDPSGLDQMVEECDKLVHQLRAN